MRKLGMALALAGLLALPAAAMAHPSENRNPQGFGGGPHCHFVNSGPSQSRAYPSHTAHASQIANKPNGTVFSAAPCP
jgi:hypothetical protein